MAEAGTNLRNRSLGNREMLHILHAFGFDCINQQGYKGIFVFFLYWEKIPQGRVEAFRMRIREKRGRKKSCLLCPTLSPSSPEK